MKKTFNIISGLLLTLLFLSCEKQTTWELRSSDKFRIADCILTNEMKYQVLRLYESSDRLNEEPVGIPGAHILITDGNHVFGFREDSLQPGLYISSEPFIASAGNIYQLTISLGDDADTAFAEMTGVTPLETIDIITAGDLFRFIYHDSPQASMTEIYYDWSADTAYCREYGACKASEVFYTLDNIDVAKEFAPDKQIILFPKNTRIIRKKYSLSTSHQDFIRAMLLETEWRGGLFDAEPGDVPTNFLHSFRGWFAACTVVSDTITYK
jgi:hypothetical protein